MTLKIFKTKLKKLEIELEKQFSDEIKSLRRFYFKIENQDGETK